MRERAPDTMGRRLSLIRVDVLRKLAFQRAAWSVTV